MPVIKETSLQGLSHRTMKMVKETAAQVMELAVDNGIAEKNPFRNIKIPSTPSTGRREATQFEQQMIA